MSWIHDLMDDYYRFLKDKTKLTTNDPSGWIEINTPFIGLFNDGIDIYVKRENNKIILSDDGNTLHNLELIGVNIFRSTKKKEIVDAILLNYGVEIREDELIIEATAQNFAQKKINMLCAITEISDLSYLTKSTVTSLFKEKVKNFLDEQQIIYTPEFTSKGSTGLEFTFDIQIAYRKKEIIIKSFNNIDKGNLPQFLFTWKDIKKERERLSKKDIVGIAIINDKNKEINNDLITALHSEKAEHIFWSERNAPININKLTA